MGICTDIKNRYILGEWAPLAIYNANTNHLNHVIIDDALLWLPYCLGNKKHVTPRDYMNRILHRAMEYYKSGAIAYIIILDDYQNIPEEKAFTQQKRRLYSRLYAQRRLAKQQVNDINEYMQISTEDNDDIIFEPYSIDKYKLELDGILNLETNELEPIEQERLRDNKPFRHQLWKLIVDNIDTRNNYSLFPSGHCLIIDFDSSGPYLFDTKNKNLHLTELKHDHGESDPSIVFYCWLFHQYDIHIISRDTDLIPIITSYLSYPLSYTIYGYHTILDLHSSKEIMWIFDRPNNKCWNMKELCRQLQINMKNKTLIPFLFVCIISGTDFFVIEQLLQISTSKRSDLAYIAYKYSEFIHQLLFKQFNLIEFPTIISKEYCYFYIKLVLQFFFTDWLIKEKEIKIIDTSNALNNIKHSLNNKIKSKKSENQRSQSDDIDNSNKIIDKLIPERSHTESMNNNYQFWTIDQINFRLNYYKMKTRKTKTKDSETIQFPTDNLLQEAANKFHWNLWYWHNRWQDFTCEKKERWLKMYQFCDGSWQAVPTCRNH